MFVFIFQWSCMTGEICFVITTVCLCNIRVHTWKATPLIASILSDSRASLPPHVWLYSDAAGLVTLFAACASWPCVHPVGLSVYGLVDGAASSAGMLWERLFLLVHTKLGLSLLLCTSDTHSWAVTDTSRDVDLCQKHKMHKTERAASHTQTPPFTPLTKERREEEWDVCSGNNLECHTSTANEQKHHSEPILGLIQNISILINIENGSHSCIC